MGQSFRSAALGATAIAVAVTLAACGSATDTNNQDSDVTGAAPTTNQQVTRPPNFTDPDQRLAAMSAEGCGAGFEEWAHDTIVYFTERNGGDWENVQVTFTPGASIGAGHKSCEVGISGAAITGTSGGDLNDATITVVGMPQSENSYDTAVSRSVVEGQSGGSQRFEHGYDDISVLEGMSMLTDSMLDYAATKGMLRDAAVKTTPGNPTEAQAYLFSSDTALVATFDAFNFPEDAPETESDMYGGGWAAVSTSDAQAANTGEDSRTAAGALAQVLTRGMTNRTNESDWTI